MTNPFFWPVMLAGFERIVIVLCALMVAWMGYRLFLGSVESRSKFSYDGSLGKFVLSGAGPGLFFMAFSCAVLAYALSTSGIRADLPLSDTGQRADHAVPPASAIRGSTAAAASFASSAPAQVPQQSAPGLPSASASTRGPSFASSAPAGIGGR